MLRINFYGGPGVGKSTLAAHVYAELNQYHQVSVELVREFVKTWAYEGREPDGWDQVYTYASQLYEEHRLAKAGVQIIVTDSPVLLQCMYAALKNAIVGSHLLNLALLWEKAHPALNFLIERHVIYTQSGRFQTPSTLVNFDKHIVDCLESQQIPYTTVVPGYLDTIIQTVKKVAHLP